MAENSLEQQGLMLSRHYSIRGGDLISLWGFSLAQAFTPG